MQLTQVLFFVLQQKLISSQVGPARKNAVIFSIFFFYLIYILVVNVGASLPSLIQILRLWENIVVNFFGRKVKAVYLQFNGLNISWYNRGHLINKVNFSAGSIKKFNNYTPLATKNNLSILWYSTNNLRPNPVVIYSNLESEKSSIYADNKDKSGIYLWRNKINGKTYIGSSVNLTKRLKNYFNESYLTRLKDFMIIYKALLVYGYENFTLEILEYCDSASILEREQYYLDTLKPEYNVLKIAGSSFGYKHSEETLLKMRNRTVSLEARLKMSEKNHKRQAVVIINNQTGDSAKFSTMKKAGIFLNIGTTTIGKYIKSNKLYKGIYSIKKDL